MVAGGLFFVATNTNSTQVEIVDSAQSQLTTSTITINQAGTVVSYPGVEGETALDTLKKLADVRVEESAYGEFVTGIGVVEADATKNFWGYTVNGEFADVGAGEYVAKEGDQIEWQLTDLN